MTKEPQKGHGVDIVDLMRMHDLFVVDTLFKPKRKKQMERQINIGIVSQRTCEKTRADDRQNWNIHVYQIDGKQWSQRRKSDG